jgi:hypothetical protein
MYLIQLLLPLRKNDGSPQPGALFGEVRDELMERFGGLTSFSRAPAEGLWDSGDSVDRDQVIVLEVMADELERDWWRDYRAQLEPRFVQDEIMIRASVVERL